MVLNLPTQKSALGQFKAEVVSLQEFFEMVKKASIPDEPIRLVTSELRDNSRAFEYARAYMLDGVLSTRLYLKT